MKDKVIVFVLLLFNIFRITAGNSLGRSVAEGAANVFEKQVPVITEKATDAAANVLEARAPGIAQKATDAAFATIKKELPTVTEDVVRAGIMAAMSTIQSGLPQLTESGSTAAAAISARAMQAALTIVKAQAPTLAHDVAQRAIEAAVGVFIEKAKETVEKIPLAVLRLGIKEEGGIQRRRNIRTAMLGDCLRIYMAATAADGVLNQLTTDQINYVYEFDYAPLKAGDTLLLAAARNGAERIVEGLIARGANVDCRDADGNTPLMWAARQGFFNIANLLMRAGAHANNSNPEGMTALLEAIHNHHPGVARIIANKLQNRRRFFASCRAIDRTDLAEPSLSQCAEYGWVKPARVLISLDTDVNAAGPGGATPLTTAAAKNQVAMAQLLLDNHAQGLHDAIIAAARAGHNTMLTFLLGAATSSEAKTKYINTPDVHGITALMAAAQNGHVPTLNLLLETGADFRVTRQDNNVFTLAADNNRVDVISALVQRPDIQSWLTSEAGKNTYEKVSQIAEQHKRADLATIVLPSNTQLPPGHIRIFRFTRQS